MLPWLDDDRRESEMRMHRLGRCGRGQRDLDHVAGQILLSAVLGADVDLIGTRMLVTVGVRDFGSDLQGRQGHASGGTPGMKGGDDRRQQHPDKRERRQTSENAVATETMHDVCRI